MMRLLLAALVASASLWSAHATRYENARLANTGEGTLVIFPDRDFITIEGFQDKIGFEFHIEVWRNLNLNLPQPNYKWVKVGDSRGEGAAVEGGAVLGEVNHPGAYCWGATGPQSKKPGMWVTPDLRGGDEMYISWDQPNLNNSPPTPTLLNMQYAVVQHQFIEPEVKGLLTGGIRFLTTGDADFKNTIEVYGWVDEWHVAHPSFMESRIINPDMKDIPGGTGRRDARAAYTGVTNGVKPDLAADVGYSSALWYDFRPGTSKMINGREMWPVFAEYVFTDAVAAEVAATGGGFRLLAWQATDDVGERYGITIHELGEMGGPGVGGCPSGPLDTIPPKPLGAFITTEVSKDAGKDIISAYATWTEAVDIPDASPVVGYSVVGYLAPFGPSPETTEYASVLGRMVLKPTREGAPFTPKVNFGIVQNALYKVEVRSLAANGQLSPAFTVSTEAPTKGEPPSPPAQPVSFPPADSVTAQGVTGDKVLIYLGTGDATATVLYTVCQLGQPGCPLEKGVVVNPLKTTGNSNEVDTSAWVVAVNPSNENVKSCTLVKPEGETAARCEIMLPDTATSAGTALRVQFSALGVNDWAAAPVTGLYYRLPSLPMPRPAIASSSISGGIQLNLSAGPAVQGLESPQTVTSFRVQQTSPELVVPAPVGTPVWPVIVTGTTFTMTTGVTAGTAYTFEVAAASSEGIYGPTQTVTVTAGRVTNQVIINGARWKTDEFRVTGQSTTANTAISITNNDISFDVVGATRITYMSCTSGALAAPVFPSAVGFASFDCRTKTGVPRTLPPPIYAHSRTGFGKAGPFTVAASRRLGAAEAEAEGDLYEMEVPATGL